LISYRLSIKREKRLSVAVFEKKERGKKERKGREKSGVGVGRGAEAVCIAGLKPMAPPLRLPYSFKKRTSKLFPTSRRILRGIARKKATSKSLFILPSFP